MATDLTPTRKVTAASIGGSGASVLVLMLARWFGLDVTPEEAIIVGGLLSAGFAFAAGYLVPDPRVVGSSHPDAPPADPK